MNEGPDLQAWAASSFAPAEERARTLPPGEVEGTARHPFQPSDRAEYIAMIQGAGIASRSHSAPIALVNLSDLVGIQSSVNRERLGMHIADPNLYAPGARASGHGALIDRPLVVKVGGRFWIHDGHHRLTAMHLRGQATAKVRLIDLDAERGG